MIPAGLLMIIVTNVILLGLGLCLVYLVRKQ